MVDKDWLGQYSEHGTLIEPDLIPGVEISAADISSSAVTYRKVGTQVRQRGHQVVARWSAIAGVYEAPESSQLVAAMNPVSVDAGRVGGVFTSLGRALDDLASAVADPVSRLRALQSEARTFRASIPGNQVWVGPFDTDNPHYTNNVAYNDAWMGNASGSSSSAGGSRPPVSGGEWIPWDHHDPTVVRNNQLLDDVATQVQRLLAASAECVNIVNGLNTDQVCFVPAIAPTKAEMGQATDFAWGQKGRGDRSCGESVGDGFYVFGTGMRDGFGALIGWDASTDQWGWGTAGKAWSGVGQALGALVIAGTPLAALSALPDGAVPGPLQGVHDWHRTQMDNIVGGIVGTPEDWDKDPVAAGTTAVLNVGTFFIPAVGIVGGSAKVATAFGRAGLAAERAAALTAEGSRLGVGLTHTAAGLARAGELTLGLSTRLDDLTRLGRPDTPADTLDLGRLAAQLDEDIPAGTHTTPQAAHVPEPAIAGGAARADNSTGSTVDVPHAREPAVASGGHSADGTTGHGPRDTSSGGSGGDGGTGHSDGSGTGHGADSGGDGDGLPGGSGGDAVGSGPVDSPGSALVVHPAPTPHAFDPATGHGYGSGDPHRPGNPEVTVPTEAYVRGSGEPGWTHIRAQDSAWADYQMQIAGVERATDGRLPEWVEIGPDGKDVKFDGHVIRDGHPPLEVLLDAKDGYRGLAFNKFDDITTYWGKRADSLAAQAERQMNALPDSAVIEWHVSDPYGAAGIQQVLESKGILPDDIRVIYTPKL